MRDIVNRKMSDKKGNFMRDIVNKKKKLLIIGAGGHGKVVANIALVMNRWETIAFLDDDSSIKKSLGFEVIGNLNDVSKYISEYDIFVAIGKNSVRERVQKDLELKNASIPVLIHPNTVIGSQVEIGEGTVIMAGTVINCCAKIGKGCIINTSATIDHDTRLGDFVHVSPGTKLAGSVVIEKNTWLGIGSVVSNNIKIAENCIVGAGSLVLRDITESGIYVGSPVRKIN